MQQYIKVKNKFLTNKQSLLIEYTKQIRNGKKSSKKTKSYKKIIIISIRLIHGLITNTFKYLILSISIEKGRQDNSLSVLTKKFIQLIKQRQDYTIDLNEAVDKLKVQKRRIYDITNVLEGINYVQKLQKNTIKWIGGNQSPQLEKDIDQLKRKYQQLTEQQKRLDQSIEDLNRQIKTDFLQNQQLRQYHYITYQDCLNICKAMNKTDNSKSLIILSAPKGASLQAMSLEEGCQLKMDSNGKGPIKVYTCQQKTGVKELQPSRQ